MASTTGREVAKKSDGPFFPAWPLFPGWADASGTFLNIWENTAPIGTPTFQMLEDSIDGLIFNLGGGNDTININRLDRSMPLTIHGEAGSDTINIGSASGSLQSPASVDGGADHDTINVIETASGAPATIVPSAGDDDVLVNIGGAGTAAVGFDATQRLGMLRIEAGGTGTMSLNGSNVLTVTQFDISGTGKLDLRDNDMIVDYTGTPSPLGSIQSLLTSGYAGGAWTGNGINTSQGNASNFALGYAEASELGLSEFSGQIVDDTTVLVKYTFYGDTDLNGNVNLTDFNRLAANFGMTGRHWFQGDFNYDTIVNLADFNLLAGNFGQFGLGPGGGGGTYGYTVCELRSHLLHGGHGLPPR